MPRPDQQPALQASEVSDSTPFFTMLSNGQIRQVTTGVLKTVIGSSVTGAGNVLSKANAKIVFSGKADATFDRTVPGRLRIVVPNIYSFEFITVAIDFSSDDVDSNNEFILEIQDTSNSVNTWSSTDLASFDLWIPTCQAYTGDETVSSPGAKLTSLTNAQNQIQQVFPDVEYGSGIIRLRFSQDSFFSSLERAIIKVSR